MLLGDSLEVVNPILLSKNRVTTLDKLQETHRLVNEIIDNLDDESIAELAGGYDEDLSKLMDCIYAEAYDVVFGNQGYVKASSISYLEKLGNNIEETLRAENLMYFIISVLPNFRLNWHIIEWATLLQKYLKLAIIASRGIGKSYFFSLAYPLWKMYRYRGKDDYTGKMRREFLLSEVGYILTNEMGLAEELIEKVKATIEENELLRIKLYPANKDNWSKRSIKCRNGARLIGKSYGSSFRGRHPGYVVVDDLLKENVLYSEDQRIKVNNYFHAVIMNAVLKGGQVPVVGTPFRNNDLYGDLKEKSGWKVLEYPAIFPDGTLLWPEMMGMKTILEKREDQGSIIFSREILVKPIVSESSIFPYDLLKRSFVGMENYTLVKNRESFPIKFNKVVTGCDFAMSASVGADFSVFGTWGIDAENNMWLLHIWRAKGKSYFEQLSMLKSIYVNFKPDVMYLEANQFQKIFSDGALAEGLPVYPHTTGTNKYDLKGGLPGLALMFERFKIKLPRGDQYSRDMTDLMCSEFASVTWTEKGLEGVGQHDDCPMMTWQSSLAAKHMETGLSWGFLDD